MNTTKTLTIVSILSAYLVTMASCVDHRPLRNEVFNENIYLPKDFLTRENPNRPGTGDHAWLYNVTVVKSSSPDIGLLTQGDNSQPRYVRFQFAPTTAEMVDDNEYYLGTDKDGKPIYSDSLTPAVINAWPGTHVDIKMKDNLDGERTNVIEENRELDWQQRQYFKVDFQKAAVTDVNMLAWYISDYYIGECATLRSVSLVPNSFELEQDADKSGDAKGDDYFSWTVALTYEESYLGGCSSKLTDAMNRHTYTFHVKYSFWRPPDNSDYAKNRAIELPEKHPIRKKLMPFETGIFNQMTVYHDPNTDLAGAKSYVMRFDPDKEHTFYFSPSFPEQYRDHFRTTVANQFNDLAKGLGIKMRIHFQDNDYCGVADRKQGKCECEGESCKLITPRTFGDLRYSYLVFHDYPSTGGLIGMAYMNSDPRTGEILSGGFNIYDWSDHLYAYYMQDYISQVTGDLFDKDNTGIPKTCKVGDQVKINDQLVADKFKYTSLYTKLETYMREPAEEWVHERSQDFGKYMRMLMPDLRFAVPWWNSYVWRDNKSRMAQLSQMRETERKLQEHISAIDRGESPFGTQNILTKAGIEQGLASINAFKEGVRNHQQLRTYRHLKNAYRMADTWEGWELGPAMMRSSRTCIKDPKTGNPRWETRDEWAHRIVANYFKIFSTHEFGHTLSLRHNFYGSMDKPHFGNDGNDLTSSIMEYAYTMAEAGDMAKFKPWDVMALKWIYGSKPDDLDAHAPDPKENWLFCTDEHRFFSPFCWAHDIGTTPSELVKNEIDLYEWQYKFRNFRAYRKFWSLGSYGTNMLYRLWDLRRLLHVWALDLYPEDVKNDLTLLGVKGDEKFFANITDEFIEEFGQANRMVVNFYKAILQQSAGERTYATSFDNFYGDVTQQGIILDKYYAMYLFIGLWPVDWYDQNLYAYLAYYEGSRNNAQYYSDCQDVVDSMLGGQYDVYPWFKPTAVLLYAQDTHDVMFGDNSKQKWIEMLKFERKSDLMEYFDGLDPTVEALAFGNVYQTFKDKKGDDWIYYYMIDRKVHLVANKNKNPTAFRILWDQNESINFNKSTGLDDYEIKYYLDFYEYFN